MNTREFDPNEFKDLCNALIAEFNNEELNLSTATIYKNNADISLSNELTENGEGLTATAQRFNELVAPNLARNYSPRFFNWVVGGRTPAAVLGDFYVTLFDQIVMLSSHGIAAKLEEQTINWLLALFSLPEYFQGIFTTGATESNLCCLAAARQWYGKMLGIDIKQEGLFGVKPPCIITAAHHSSIDKSLQILGLGRQSIVNIAQPNTKMDLALLEEHLKANKYAIVIANCGEVNTGSCDDLKAIAALCQRYEAWLHVDAAFGLFARCSKYHQGWTDGIELADSISSDGHKLGNVPYGCGFLFIKKDKYLHLRDSFAAVAPYLASIADHPMNTRVGNSQRFIALPFWFALQAYGKGFYKDMVETQFEFAQAIAEWLTTQSDFEVLAPTEFNIVLFRHKQVVDTKQNQRLIECINKTNLLSLSGTVFNGTPAMRIAIANWRTNVKDDYSATCTGLTEGAAHYKKGMN